jgi:hypothetical protein
MNAFQDTPITDRATGQTFRHRSYCASPAEATALARLTFTNPAVYAVGDNLSCAPRESQPDHFSVVGSLEKPASSPAPGAVSGAPSPNSGKTAYAAWHMGIQNLDHHPTTFQPAQQPELF